MTHRSFCPTGTILFHNASTVPDGWLKCEGTPIRRDIYAALFSAVGTAWGSGDGTTTFHLPDLQGLFLRGHDGGVGRDPDRSSRIALNSGGAVGDNVGSFQASSLLAHTHSISGSFQNQTLTHTHNNALSGSFYHDHSGTLSTVGGHNHAATFITYLSRPSSGDAELVAWGDLFTITEPSTGMIDEENYEFYDIGHSGTSGNGDGSHSHATIDGGLNHKHTATINSNSSGVSESRPVNVYQNYIIKY